MSDGLKLVLSLVAPALVAVIGVYGVRYTARQTTKAKASELDLEKTKVQADAYTHARAALLDTTADLRKDVSDLRAAMSAQAVEHRQQVTDQAAEHRRQIAELREERREHDAMFNARMDDLESQHDEDRRRIQDLNKVIESLNAYIRALIRMLRDRQIVPPPAPPGMTFD